MWSMASLWPHVLTVVTMTTLLDGRVLREQVTDLESFRDPTKSAVEKTIEETSDLLSQLRGYDEVSHQICLELQYESFASVQVSASCVKFYVEPECHGRPSQDRNGVVSLGKRKLASCNTTSSGSVPSGHTELVETSVKISSPDYTLPDLPNDGEFEPWKSSTVKTSTVTATVLIVHQPSNASKSEYTNSDQEIPSCQHKCKAMDPYGINWEVCLSGTGFQGCPTGSEGRAVWQCGGHGEFVQMYPDYSECNSDWIGQAQSSILSVGEPTNKKGDASAREFFRMFQKPGHRFDPKRTTALVLENVSSPKPRYFGHEIPGILTLLDRVATVMDLDNGGVEEAEAVAATSVVILDTVASKRSAWAQLSPQQHLVVGNQLIQTLESTLFKLAKVVRQAGKSRYGKNFQRSSHMTVQLGAVPRTSTGEQEIVGQSPGDPKVKLPAGWTEACSPTGSVNDEIFYVQMTLDADTVRNLIPSNEFDKQLNSKLVTVSIPSQNEVPQQIQFKERGIQITFPHDTVAVGGEGMVGLPRRRHDGESPTIVRGTARCVYWDTTKLEWSPLGCRLISSGKAESTCECMHLTSFALLMDAHQYVGKNLGIVVLTRLLCTLSCICLLSTIIIFKKLHSVRNPRSSVTIHLCISLLVGNILLLTLMDRDNFPLSNGLCAFVGMTTHFVFLCAFAWMGIEGFIVYKMVVDVFESGTENKIKLRLIAYGVPLAIVLTFLTLHLSTDGSIYGGELFCWLQGNYIWTFIVPVFLVCTFNFFVLVIALRTAFKKKTTSAGAKQSGTLSRTMVIGTLSLTCLLGLTWIFGFFLTIPNYIGAIVGAYFFTIFNASQGIFIFIFHCWMNKQVRTVLRRRVSAWHSSLAAVDHTKQGRSDESSQATHTEPSTGTKSTNVRNSEGEELATMLPPISETPKKGDKV